MVKRLTRKSRLQVLAGILCLGLITGIAWTLFHPTESDAAWFDDNYAYRAKETIGNSGAATTDKKVKLDIDTATLITAGKMQSDCDDTRFTDINGNKLKYYLDSTGGACNTASTDYYILVSTINGADDTIIYMYYGNPAATSGSQPSQFSQSTFSPTSGPTGATEEKAPGPVAYWKFDDGTGTTAQDSTTSNNDATLGSSTAAPTWQAEDQCISGKCLRFDGSNDIVQPTSTIVANLSAYTISGWFRSTMTGLGTSGGAIYSEGSSSSSTPTLALRLNRFNVGDVSFEHRGASATMSIASVGTTYNDGKWHYISGVRNSTSSFSLYVDGILKGTSATDPGTTSVTSSRIGAVFQNNALTTFFSGTIDDVKIYSSARSSSQVLSDFNSNGSTITAANSIGSTDPSRSLSNGLVGYWKMDETSWATNCSTTSVTDSSGNAQNGKACPNASAAAVGVAKFANGGVFDGTNDYVSVTHNDILRANSTPTVCVWAQRTGAGDGSTSQMLVDKSSGLDAYSLLLEPEGTAVIWRLTKFGVGTVDISASVTTTDMHHYCGTFDGTTSRLYVDGVFKSSAAAQLDLSGNTTELRFGSSTGNDKFFQGKLDDIRLYNRALSQQEIATLADWAPAPIVNLPLDERTGTSSVNDTSGNGFSGTMSGFASTDWLPGKYGSSLSFDGTNNYLSFADNSTLDVANTITIESWIKPHALTASDDGIAVKAGAYELRFTNAGKPAGRVLGATSCGGSPASGVLTASAVTLDTWTHIAWTYDGTTNQIYVNGVLNNSSIETCSIPNSVNALEVGKQSNYFNGSIDELKVYNYVRTQKQIVQDMNGNDPAVGGAPMSLGYWSFNEGQGTTANNTGSGGSTINGTLTSMSAPATSTSGWNNTGKVGRALEFDGTNDYVNIADTNILDISGAVSVSAWIKKSNTTATTRHILTKGTRINGTTNNYALINDGSNLIQFQVSNGGTIYGTTSSTAINDTSWHHLVGTYIPSIAVRVYIDGKLSGENTTSIPSSITTNSNALRIGLNSTDTERFAGTIDEVKLYTIPLNADEVKLEYNQGKSQIMGSFSTASDGITSSAGIDRIYCVPGDTSSCSGPVGEWNFDERSGTTVNDTSGNANTGTITGTITWEPGKKNAALNFDGVNSGKVGAGSGTSLDDLAALSTYAWIYPRTVGQSSDARIIHKSAGGPINGWYITTTASNSIKFQSDYSTTDLVRQSANSSLALNTWNFVEVTWDGSSTATNVHIYINGMETTYATTTNGVGSKNSDASSNLEIGNSATGNRTFDGKIDSVAVLNYVRTPAQVAWDYNRGGPIAWYKLNECQGTTVNDSSGNGNSGTITIGATSTYTSAGTCSSGTSTHAWNGGTTGKFNQSLGFDGTDDYISIPATTSLNSLTAGLTVSLWVNPSTLPSAFKRFISRGSNPSQQWEIEFNSTVGKLFYGAGGSSASTGTITAGAWHHIVMTFDPVASSTKLYINGKLDSSVSGGSSLSASSAIGIGADPDGTDLYSGLIDDVRIFNYPLTLKQIQLLYNENSAVRYGPTTGAP